jgi:hypothetical protein
MRDELSAVGRTDGQTDMTKLIVSLAILRMHLKLVTSTQPVGKII